MCFRLFHILVLLILVFQICPSAMAENDLEAERSLGCRLAAEFERNVTFVTGPLADRVTRIGERLAQIATSHLVLASYGSSEPCNFRYKFNVVKDSDVNAFSLPGGYIYVDSGLLEMIDSDDELAGILAHEIAHAAHHHVMTILKDQKSVEKYIALATFASILGSARGADLQNVLVGAEFLKLGRQNQHTMAAEEDADCTAVEYMLIAGYNPQAFIDLLRKLEKKQDAGLKKPLGIFQTHPAPHKRIAYLAQMLASKGIRVETGLLPQPIRARVLPADGLPDVYQVVVGGKVVFVPAELQSGVAPKERAEEIAKRIDCALESGVSSVDVHVDLDASTLFLKGSVLLTIEPEDEQISGRRDFLLQRAKNAMIYAIWADLVNRCNSNHQDTVVAKR
jgi:hypothetical protein